ncbi:MAG: sulfotransferase [bacterium]|nr:MAG: sulfotransferase [bacterium]
MKHGLPDAKIVHNYRDCRETAISMMTGSFFRLYLELTKNPDLDEWDSDYMPPLEEMGSMLNQWIVDAVGVLESLPDHQKMNLSYEDLMDDCMNTLLHFSNFVFERQEPTPEDIEWAEKECNVIERVPLRYQKLSRDEQEKLQNICYESLKTLGYE